MVTYIHSKLIHSTSVTSLISASPQRRLRDLFPIVAGLHNQQNVNIGGMAISFFKLGR